MKRISITKIIAFIAIAGVIYYACPKDGTKRAIPKTSSDTTNVQTEKGDSIPPAPFEASAVSFLSSPSNEQFQMNLFLIGHEQEIRQRLTVIVNDFNYEAAAKHPITDEDYGHLLASLTKGIVPNSNKGMYCNHWGVQPCPCGGKYEIDSSHRFWN